MNPDHHWLTGLKCDYKWEVLLWGFCSIYNQIFRAVTQLSEIFPVELGEKSNSISFVAMAARLVVNQRKFVWFLRFFFLFLNMPAFTLVQLVYWRLMLKFLIAPCMKTMDEFLCQSFVRHVGFFSFNPTERLSSTGTLLSELDTQHHVCLQSSPFKTCQAEALET